jgi:hypothetical protein
MYQCSTEFRRVAGVFDGVLPGVLALEGKGHLLSPNPHFTDFLHFLWSFDHSKIYKE